MPNKITELNWVYLHNSREVHKYIQHCLSFCCIQEVLKVGIPLFNSEFLIQDRILVRLFILDEFMILFLCSFYMMFFYSVSASSLFCIFCVGHFVCPFKVKSIPLKSRIECKVYVTITDEF